VYTWLKDKLSVLCEYVIFYHLVKFFFLPSWYMYQIW